MGGLRRSRPSLRNPAHRINLPTSAAWAPTNVNQRVSRCPGSILKSKQGGRFPRTSGIFCAYCMSCEHCRIMRDHCQITKRFQSVSPHFVAVVGAQARAVGASEGAPRTGENPQLPIAWRVCGTALPIAMPVFGYTHHPYSSPELTIQRYAIQFRCHYFRRPLYEKKRSDASGEKKGVHTSAPACNDLQRCRTLCPTAFDVLGIAGVREK